MELTGLARVEAAIKRDRLQEEARRRLPARLTADGKGLALVEATIKAERLHEEASRRRSPITLTAPDGSKLKGIALTELLAAGFIAVPDHPKVALGIGPVKFAGGLADEINILTQNMIRFHKEAGR